MPEATPPAAGEAGPQQAPMGVSSASGPTPNKGYEAQVIQQLGGVAQRLHQMIPIAGAHTEIGKAIYKALGEITKFLPAGPQNQQALQNDAKQMMMRQAQNAQLMQSAKPQMQPQGGAQPPGGPPGMMRAA